MENKRGVEYLLIGIAIIVALVGSYFGITLPSPSIPPAADGGRVVSSAGIDTDTSAQFYNGSVMTFYSDNHDTPNIVLNGATGALSGVGAFSSTGRLSAAGLSSTANNFGTNNYLTGAVVGATGAITSGLTVGNVRSAADVTANTAVVTNSLTAGAVRSAADVTGLTGVFSTSVTTGAYLGTSAGLTGAVAGNTGVFTTSLTVGGVQVAGGYKYGAAANISNGSQITHGLSTTPTMALITAGSPITSPIYILQTGLLTFSVGISDTNGSLVVIPTIYWLAGK